MIPATFSPRQLYDDRGLVGRLMQRFLSDGRRPRFARVGVIDRSIGGPPCARRCRRTEARYATVASDDQELLALQVGPVVEGVGDPGPACDLAVASDRGDCPMDVRTQEGQRVFALLPVEDPGGPHLPDHLGDGVLPFAPGPSLERPLRRSQGPRIKSGFKTGIGGRRVSETRRRKALSHGRSHPSYGDIDRGDRNHL
jgi:hypothetical protein